MRRKYRATLKAITSLLVCVFNNSSCHLPSHRSCYCCQLPLLAGEGVNTSLHIRHLNLLQPTGDTLPLEWRQQHHARRFSTFPFHVGRPPVEAFPTRVCESLHCAEWEEMRLTMFDSVLQADRFNFQIVDSGASILQSSKCKAFMGWSPSSTSSL